MRNVTYMRISLRDRHSQQEIWAVSYHRAFRIMMREQSSVIEGGETSNPNLWVLGCVLRKMWNVIWWKYLSHIFSSQSHEYALCSFINILTLDNLTLSHYFTNSHTTMTFVYLILHSHASKLPAITWKRHSILKIELNTHTQCYSCVPLYELEFLGYWTHAQHWL